MAKIVNLDGSAAGSEKPVDELTEDPGLRKLMNCRDGAEFKTLWLTGQCDAEDLQVGLLLQLSGDIQQLSHTIAVLLAKLETLTKQTNTRVN